jgi:hypothetical protein
VRVLLISAGCTGPFAFVQYIAARIANSTALEADCISDGLNALIFFVGAVVEHAGFAGLQLGISLTGCKIIAS